MSVILKCWIDVLSSHSGQSSFLPRKWPTHPQWVHGRILVGQTASMCASTAPHQVQWMFHCGQLYLVCWGDPHVQHDFDGKFLWMMKYLLLTAGVLSVNGSWKWLIIDIGVFLPYLTRCSPNKHNCSQQKELYVMHNFYRSRLCHRAICFYRVSVPVSVCLCVTMPLSIKMAAAFGTQ